MREERLHLRVQLRGERLVVAHDERRTVQLLDDVGNGKRLAATGYAEQNLRFCAGFHSLDQRLYRLRLVSRGFIWRFELEHFLKK